MMKKRKEIFTRHTLFVKRQASTDGICTRHNPTVRKQVSNSRNNFNCTNCYNNSVNNISRDKYWNASWR